MPLPPPPALQAVPRPPSPPLPLPHFRRIHTTPPNPRVMPAREAWIRRARVDSTASKRRTRPRARRHLLAISTKDLREVLRSE
ncbi:MAG TPA: hypothetical protein DCP95_11855 [Microbacterium ginsengisoli]|uniref:Uncharacterized protein n=1 Tax=Microbacterium ginsengisoli TaxID=400772 RepID=A0A3C1KF16_9MICO|nr:hypothetical protein [Microbacterium ginsengisoli]